MSNPRSVHDFSEKAYLEDAKSLTSGDQILDFAYFEGRMAIENKEYKNGLAAFERAAKLLAKQKPLPKKLHAKISLYTGICYANLGKQDLAIKHYNEAIENLPQDENCIYLKARTHHKRALSYHLSGNNVAAKKDFAIAFPMTPKKAMIYTHMTDEYSTIFSEAPNFESKNEKLEQKKLQQDETTLSESSETKVFNPNEYFFSDKACQELQICDESQNPEIDKIYRKARELLDKKQDAKAFEEFKKIVPLLKKDLKNPLYSIAYSKTMFYMGKIFANQQTEKNAENAISFFNKAIAHIPNLPESALNPPDFKNYQFEIYYERALQNQFKKENLAAEADFKEAIELAPIKSYERKKAEDSYAKFKDAINPVTKESEANLIKGLRYLYNNDIVNAIKYLKDAPHIQKISMTDKRLSTISISVAQNNLVVSIQNLADSINERSLNGIGIPESDFDVVHILCRVLRNITNNPKEISFSYKMDCSLYNATEDFTKAYLFADLGEKAFRESAFYFHRARALYGLKKKRAAIEQLEKTLQLDPTFTTAKKLKNQYQTNLLTEEFIKAITSISENKITSGVEFFVKNSPIPPAVLKKLEEEIKEHILEKAIENLYQVILEETKTIFAKANETSYIPTETEIKRIENQCSVLTCLSTDTTHNSQSCYFLGKLNYYRNNFEDAIIFFSQGIEVNPLDTHAYYYRGLCLEALNHNDQAYTNFTQVLTFDPAYEKAFEALQRVSYKKSPVKDGSEKKDSAMKKNIEQIRKGLELLESEIHEGCKILNQFLPMSPQLIAAYDIAFPPDDNNNIRCDGMETLDTYLGTKFKSILNKFESTTAPTDKEKREFTVYCNILQSYDRRPEIIAKINYYAGMIAAKLGKNIQAVESFTAAIEQNKDSAHSYYERGLIYKKLNNIPAASKDFANVLRIYPLHEKAQSAMISLLKKSSISNSNEVEIKSPSKNDPNEVEIETLSQKPKKRKNKKKQKVVKDTVAPETPKPEPSLSEEVTVAKQQFDSATNSIYQSIENGEVKKLSLALEKLNKILTKSYFSESLNQTEQKFYEANIKKNVPSVLNTCIKKIEEVEKKDLPLAANMFGAFTALTNIHESNQKQFINRQEKIIKKLQQQQRTNAVKDTEKLFTAIESKIAYFPSDTKHSKDLAAIAAEIELVKNNPAIDKSTVTKISEKYPTTDLTYLRDKVQEISAYDKEILKLVQKEAKEVNELLYTKIQQFEAIHAAHALFLQEERTAIEVVLRNVKILLNEITQLNETTQKLIEDSHQIPLNTDLQILTEEQEKIDGTVKENIQSIKQKLGALKALDETLKKITPPDNLQKDYANKSEKSTQLLEDKIVEKLENLAKDFNTKITERITQTKLLEEQKAEEKITTQISSDQKEASQLLQSLQNILTHSRSLQEKMQLVDTKNLENATKEVHSIKANFERNQVEIKKISDRLEKNIENSKKFFESLKTLPIVLNQKQQNIVSSKKTLQEELEKIQQTFSESENVILDKIKKISKEIFAHQATVIEWATVVETIQLKDYKTIEELKNVKSKLGRAHIEIDLALNKLSAYAMDLSFLENAEKSKTLALTLVKEAERQIIKIQQMQQMQNREVYQSLGVAQSLEHKFTLNRQFPEMIGKGADAQVAGALYFYGPEFAKKMKFNDSDPHFIAKKPLELMTTLALDHGFVGYKLKLKPYDHRIKTQYKPHEIHVRQFQTSIGYSVMDAKGNVFHGHIPLTELDFKIQNPNDIELYRPHFVKIIQKMVEKGHASFPGVAHFKNKLFHHIKLFKEMEGKEIDATIAADDKNYDGNQFVTGFASGKVKFITTTDPIDEKNYGVVPLGNNQYICIDKRDRYYQQFALAFTGTYLVAPYKEGKHEKHSLMVVKNFKKMKRLFPELKTNGKAMFATHEDKDLPKEDREIVIGYDAFIAQLANQFSLQFKFNNDIACCQDINSLIKIQDFVGRTALDDKDIEPYLKAFIGGLLQYRQIPADSIFIQDILSDIQNFYVQNPNFQMDKAKDLRGKFNGAIDRVFIKRQKLAMQAQQQMTMQAYTMGNHHVIFAPPAILPTMSGTPLQMVPLSPPTARSPGVIKRQD